MTEQEAIDYLIDPIGKRDQHDEAIDMAIKALRARQTCDQIRWERDIAIQQLADLGYGLGEKPKTNSSEIQEILNYLDTTLHPIVSPDNWNVYSELYDMVSSLSSAQPEVVRCKDCVNYRNYYDTKEQEERYVCALDGFIWKPEGYCSYAERKTADDNDKTD